MDQIKLSLESFTAEDILKILNLEKDFFSPPIPESFDFLGYSNKLSKHAKFLAVRKDSKLLGFAAFYLNEVLHQIYISHLCVHPEGRHIGLGKRMIEWLSQTYSADFSSIGLEVDKVNFVGREFYKRLNFTIKEEGEYKYLLEKKLLKQSIATENLENLIQKKHDYLLCIDSDGCVMDSMSVKHIECFGPCMVQEWKLEHFAEDACKIWNQVNLYSNTRGINRFKGLYLVLLQINESYKKIEGLDDLNAWCKNSKTLSNEALEEEIRINPREILKKALNWSIISNIEIRNKYSKIIPFKGVEKALLKASEVADIAIVSSATKIALQHEWESYGLLKYTSQLLSQETGSKEYCIARLLEAGYSQNKVIMIGDAPGDKKAADTNGIHFFPINVKYETESWNDFTIKGLDNFISLNYDEYGKIKYVEFLNNLGIS